VVKRSLPVGGYEFDDAIVALLRRDHGLSIGQPTAEGLKLEIGSARELDEELVAEVRGREAATGMPRGVALSATALRPALETPLAAIIATVRDVLEETPPELASDIAANGILLAGGGSLLLGLVRRVHDETQMPTTRADSPLTCVAEGAGRSLEELDALSRSARTSRRYGLTSSYRRPGQRPTPSQRTREASER
jgi:rod shape-determining protein MreB